MRNEVIACPVREYSGADEVTIAAQRKRLTYVRNAEAESPAQSL